MRKNPLIEDEWQGLGSLGKSVCSSEIKIVNTICLSREKSSKDLNGVELCGLLSRVCILDL